MAAAMAYIVTEWCLQSHLSTADIDSAANGLWWTRRFRWFTSPFRDTVHYSIEGCYAIRRFLSLSIRSCCCYCRGERADTTSAGQTRATGQNRRSVRWTRKPVVVKQTSHLQSPSPSPSPQRSPPERNPGIELRPIAGNRSRSGSAARLIPSSDAVRRDSSGSPSRSVADTEGGRPSYGSEAGNSRLPRASGESNVGPGRGSGGSSTLQVPGFDPHYGNERRLSV
jgi:hypothetical protein